MRSCRRLKANPCRHYKSIWLDVGHWTIIKVLHEVGFYNRVVYKKPFLSDVYRGKRFEFALEYQKWTSEE